MNKLNEKQIIKIFQKQFNKKNFVAEDVEKFKLGKDYCVIKIDTLVESTDIPPQSKINDVARKSVVACVSDFAAKGVKPKYGIISVTIPQKFSKLQIKNLSVGFNNASKEFGIKFLGGDTNKGKELVIQVILVGFTKKIIPRKGAMINDIIITTGPFGYTSAGLKILLEGKKTSPKFSKKAKNLVFRPKPKVNFVMKNKKYLTSSMDSSDGLSTTLHEMAKQSKKKFVITNFPSNDDLVEFANKNKLKPMDLIFNGGEEYEIVFTVNRKNLSKILNSAKRQKILLYLIGYVTNGVGVIFEGKNGKILIKNKGWMHFRS